MEYLEEWIIEFPKLSAALLLAAMGLGLFIPRWTSARANAVHDREQRERSDVEAVRRHVRWLREMPESAKLTWPVKSVCRPESAYQGKCVCDGLDTALVTFAERLPNGDIACHETR